MRDKLLLLLFGISAAAVAWLFWNQTQQWGFYILILVNWLVLIDENRRLKKRIQALEKH